MDEIICLEGMSYSYFGRIPAVCDISLGIKEGERFAIIGANGSGKSTLLQIMNGLMHQSTGKYFFRGNEVSARALNDKGFLRFFREHVGYVFQDSDVQLFCPTVLDELLYGPLQLEMKESEALDRAFAVMQILNIENLKDRPSYMLSGGEKKRVAIGSVLTMNPEVLLLDEPTNGLDPRTQCFLVELMLALSEAGKTLVIATHDLSLVDELHAKVALLSEDHRLEQVGSSEEILNDEELLLKVNLIHEHIHYHGQEIHKHRHSHFLFHRHEKTGQERPAINQSEGEYMMDDISKLHHLLQHWAEHNTEHARTYLDWAKKAETLGKIELSDTLREIAERTEKLDGLFKKAGDLCE